MHTLWTQTERVSQNKPTQRWHRCLACWRLRCACLTSELSENEQKLFSYTTHASHTNEKHASHTIRKTRQMSAHERQRLTPTTNVQCIENIWNSPAIPRLSNQLFLWIWLLPNYFSQADDSWRTIPPKATRNKLFLRSWLLTPDERPTWNAPDAHTQVKTSCPTAHLRCTENTWRSPAFPPSKSDRLDEERVCRVQCQPQRAPSNCFPTKNLLATKTNEAWTNTGLVVRYCFNRSRLYMISRW